MSYLAVPRDNCRYHSATFNVSSMHFWKSDRNLVGLEKLFLNEMIKAGKDFAIDRKVAILFAINWSILLAKSVFQVLFRVPGHFFVFQVIHKKQQ